MCFERPSGMGKYSGKNDTNHIYTMICILKESMQHVFKQNRTKLPIKENEGS